MPEPIPMPETEPEAAPDATEADEIELRPGYWLFDELARLFSRATEEAPKVL